MKEIQVHADNIAKHGITENEVLECFRAGQRKYKRRAGRNVYRLISQTSAGRYLELLYSERATEWFVFHAMDARPRDIKLFKYRGKHR
jgi:hypothetical protein